MFSKTISSIDLQFNKMLILVPDGLVKTARYCMCEVLRCCWAVEVMSDYCDDFNASHSAVKLFLMSQYWQYPFFYIVPLYSHPGSTGRAPWHIMRWMSHKLFPGCIVPQPAATSSKVLQSLIPLPGLWGWGGWDPAHTVQSVSQQAHKGPAASTTGNLAW